MNKFSFSLMLISIRLKDDDESEKKSLVTQDNMILT